MGRKLKALVIEISYIDDGARQQLYADYDARLFYANLKQQGFKDVVIMMDRHPNKVFSDEERDKVVLHTEFPNVSAYPTFRNIKNAMRWLVTKPKDGWRGGDELFIYYAGHGDQVEDRDGDEKDGRDECIVDADNRKISDDTMYNLMIRELPKEVHMTALFDCCNSGSILDLPYVANAGKGKWMKGVKKEKKWSGADVVLISGCKDAQISRGGLVADRFESGRKVGFYPEVPGVATKAFLVTLQKTPMISYLDLLKEMRADVAKDPIEKDDKDPRQTVQMSSTTTFNLEERMFYWKNQGK